MIDAVILAAGVGSRLRPITDRIPKCCIEIAGKKLICRITEQLAQHRACTSIRVVVGYRADQVVSALAPVMNDAVVIENPRYASTNNMESCRLALGELTFDSDVLIVNGDCIYSDEIVGRMVQAPNDRVAVDSSIYLEESMKVRVEDGVIVDLSKFLADEPGCITSIDLYKFSGETARQLYQIMSDYHARNDDNQWTEVAIRDLVFSGGSVRPIDMQGERWVEIDDHRDLRKAQRIWEG